MTGDHAVTAQRADAATELWHPTTELSATPAGGARRWWFSWWRPENRRGRSRWCDAGRRHQQPVQPQQPQYQNPVQQQYAQPQNPQTQQSPYAVNNTAPIGENAFVKALKNIPVVFTSFFKDSKTVIKTAKAEKDIILGALFSAIFFIALILGNMFLMLSMSALDFPKTLLVSLVTTVLIGGFYSVILFAYVKKYKAEENTAKAFIDSFITFSIESIPASIGWILAGLCALISVYMFLFFFVIVNYFFGV